MIISHTIHIRNGLSCQTAADLWFLYAQNGNISPIFLRSRLILSLILIEIRLKPAKKDFSFSLQHFHWLSTPPPPTPVHKAHVPLRSDPGSATDIDRSGYFVYNLNRPTGRLLESGLQTNSQIEFSVKKKKALNIIQ